MFSYEKIIDDEERKNIYIKKVIINIILLVEHKLI